MKAPRLATVIVALLSVTVFAQSDGAKKPMEPIQILDVEQAVSVALAPDGSRVAFIKHSERPLAQDVGSGFYEVFIVDNKEDAAPRGLATGEVSASRLKWSPDGKYLTALMTDAEGRRQVYRIDPGSGGTTPLTSSPNSISQYDLSPDGETIAYAAAEPAETELAPLRERGFNMTFYEEDWSHVNLYLHNTKTNETDQITDGISVFDIKFSPDGNYIAAQMAPKNLVDYRYMFKDIYLIEVETGASWRWVDVPGKLGDMAWSPNSEQLAFIAAVDILDSYAGSLYIADVLTAKKFRQLKNYTEGWNLSARKVEWFNDDNVMYLCDEGAETALRLQDVDDEFGSRRYFKWKGLSIDDFAVNDSAIAVAASEATHPADVYTIDLDFRSATRLTDLNPWLERTALGEQEVIRYNARDGLSLEGVLVYPVDYVEGRRYPVICAIHGGPESNVTNGWVTRYSRWGQVAAGRGFFVFYPNYRAGSGRGPDFSYEGYGDLAGKEFQDVLDGVYHLIDEGYAYVDKIGIGGGSYGGYFSAWAATRHTERFAAAVCFVGIANQYSKALTTDIPLEDYYVHWGVYPHENRALYMARSPVEYAEGSQTPTLVLGGTKDTRIDPSQSLELYRALKQHGEAPVRLVRYPGEGHGNRTNVYRLDFLARTMRWFEYYLQSENPTGMPEKIVDYGIE
ncbi:MAG: prolyl oligopeptidase family serine peptidase [Ignavibacteriales bacterium]|nr:prolyl oligopeptidase family serine peptidase [Ignavibacteriales bacterium]